MGLLERVIGDILGRLARTRAFEVCSRGKCDGFVELRRHRIPARGCGPSALRSECGPRTDKAWHPAIMALEKAARSKRASTEDKRSDPAATLPEASALKAASVHVRGTSNDECRLGGDRNSTSAQSLMMERADELARSIQTAATTGLTGSRMKRR